ncbi:MAG TPA: DNA polymerase I [Erysipelotrichaceae bacterium]|nr:DNA polymerase I [Erysipelotrichaceae bacterium]HQA84526.1 DNA polymerase I [Erysipelotrichaceae bacterium]
MKKLLLIDGNSMLFRAYYATVYGQSMSTSSGIPTNAIYGFALMLQKALKDIEPEYVFVAFDSDKTTYRHQIYPEYKGTRSETPEDLKTQFPIIREYLDALHITHYEKSGLEADDIIGSIAKQTRDYKIAILTSDKDLLQIVDDNTDVFLMQRGITEMARMDSEAVLEKYELTPKQIIDLKGLAGDSSDNIPGVTMVGDKTATRLLKEYKTIEGVYENIDKIKGKLQQNLINDKEKAYLSKKLATIIVDADLSDIDLSKTIYQKESKDAYDFYLKYQMKSLAGKVDLSITSENEEITEESFKERKFSLVSSIETEKLIGKALICINDDNQLLSIINEKNAYNILFSDFINCQNCLNYLANNEQKVFYNLKNWYHLADKNSFEINGNNIDLMVVAFLCDSKIKTIDNLLAKYNLTLKVEEKDNQLDLFSENNNSTELNAISNRLFYLTKILLKELKQKEMESLYFDVERPLIKILADMEIVGISVDEKVLDSIAKDTAKKIAHYEKEIHRLANKEFNVNSPKQLAEVIYDDLKLARSTKRSTDAKVLGKLIDAHPIIEEVLQYRKYAKFYSTYAFGLKKYIEEDGKIHTKFNQTVAETGRLSSSDPNLQNISIRSEDTSSIRSAFIPEEDCVLLAADYSQVELRLLAHLSQEERLIDAFKKGLDAHTKTAMDIFSVEEDKVTPLMRRQAKAINFGIDYGMSAFGLAENLNIPVGIARDFIDSYFEKYPNVKKYMDDTVAKCEQTGYVTTLLNRRREIPEIKHRNRNIKEFGKRAAMNAPVQGSAADLIKVAMINVYNQLNKRNLKSKLILQIHDELIFNVPLEEKNEVMQIVKEQMEQALTLSVPLKVEASFGRNWLEVI